MSYAKTTATKKIANLDKRIRIVQGGSSASKTISILIYLIVLAQTDKSKKITSIVSESMPHLRRGAMRDFLNIMQEHGYYKEKEWDKTNSIYTFPSGSIIEFFGIEVDEKVKGARRDRLFINEANNVYFESFNQLEIRTNDFVFIDYNPTREFWAFTELNDRDDVDKIILTYKDNEALNPSIVKTLEARQNRKGWWQVYGLGLPGEVEGRIYTGWQEINEVPHEARLERYGLDFGWHPDPAALVAVYYYNGGYILDEVGYQLEWSNREIAETLKNLPKALVVADSAEPKSIAEVKMYGINIIGTVKGADSARASIKSVKDQRISITKNSVNLLKEYRNYLWAVDKDGRVVAGIPEDGNDHLLDATRYAISSLIPVIRRRELYSGPESLPRQRSNIAV